MVDPLWFDEHHPEFGRMAEMGRIVRVGFVSNLPGLLFHRRFKGSKHPFCHEKVHEYAATIHEDLVDNMDSCIIK